MKNMTICLLQQLLQLKQENGENKMTNTTTPTAKELVMRTMITELKLMNIQLDMLENEIDEKLNK